VRSRHCRPQAPSQPGESRATPLAGTPIIRAVTANRMRRRARGLLHAPGA
jgi:hypothetical protein